MIGPRVREGGREGGREREREREEREPTNSFYRFQIPLHLGTTASIRVGNALGAGNPQKAKQAVFAALKLVQGTKSTQFMCRK